MKLEEAYPRKKRTETKKKWGLVITAPLVVGSLFWAVLIVPNLVTHNGSRIWQAKDDVENLADAIGQFKLDCGRYPTTKEGIDALFYLPKGVSNWRGPYLEDRITNDPWDHPYRYMCPRLNGHGFQVESYGADGKPGGAGEDKDIIGGSDS